MEVTPEALEEFKRIYRKEFGKDISDEDALEMAQRVLTFFSLIYRVIFSQEETSVDSNSEDFDSFHAYLL